MNQELSLHEMNEMLMDVSRTFALSIQRLPNDLQRAMALFYLLLRVSDYLEDSCILSRGQKIHFLYLWGKILKSEVEPSLLSGQLPLDDDSKDALVAKKCGVLITNIRYISDETRDLILNSVYQTTLGMARWQENGSMFITENDLDDYMFEVAGRVGLTATKIFSCYSRPISKIESQLLSLSRDTGLGLQTVNVIRGLKKDHDRGWIYVPQEFCKAVEIETTDLFNPKYQSQSLLVVDRLINKAEGHLKSAVNYISLLPPWLHPIRLACIWPLLFATRTLALSRQNVNVLVGEVKMTRDEIKTIIRDTTLFGWSNTWLDNYYRRLQSPPLVEPPSLPPQPPRARLLPVGK